MTTFPPAAYIEAELELLPPERGGRHSPIASGYRGNCWIGKLDDGVWNQSLFTTRFGMSSQAAK